MGYSIFYLEAHLEARIAPRLVLPHFMPPSHLPMALQQEESGAESPQSERARSPESASLITPQVVRVNVASFPCWALTSIY
jgi:hypothetical protein